MKTQRFIITLLALTFALAPPSYRTASAARRGPRYSAELISPRAGDVLVAGQIVRVEWRSALPEMDLSWCETEIRLSLDGGITFHWITGERDPREKHFDWVVPNTPTKTAVIDIHFGCLGYYPETSSLQLRSVFEISAVD